MQRQVRWMEFARFQSHNVESLPCIALVQVFAALWCSGALVLWLVCACKPCTQPSSQTLQSHEWRHSAYSPCKSAPQRSCGSGYKASSVARQARSLLPFNLLKVEPASHAVNTATSNLWQQFICMQKTSSGRGSTYQIQSFNWSPRVSDFFVFLWWPWVGARLIFLHLNQEASGKLLPGQEIAQNGWQMKILNTSWTQHLEHGVTNVTSIVGKSALFWQLLRPWSGLFCVLRVF